MPRGGKRLGAGSKPKWKSGKTKTVRIPEALEERVMELAKALDEGKEVVIVESNVATDSNRVLNLAGISIRSVNNAPSVYLADLVRLGYELYPQAIMKSLSLTKSSKSSKKRSPDVKRQKREVKRGSTSSYQTSLFDDF